MPFALQSFGSCMARRETGLGARPHLLRIRRVNAQEVRGVEANHQPMEHPAFLLARDRQIGAPGVPRSQDVEGGLVPDREWLPLDHGPAPPVERDGGPARRPDREKDHP